MATLSLLHLLLYPFMGRLYSPDLCILEVQIHYFVTLGYPLDIFGWDLTLQNKILCSVITSVFRGLAMWLVFYLQQNQCSNMRAPACLSSHDWLHSPSWDGRSSRLANQPPTEFSPRSLFLVPPFLLHNMTLLSH